MGSAEGGVGLDTSWQAHSCLPTLPHLQGLTQLVGSTWSRSAFKKSESMASLFPGPNFKDSMMEDPQSWVLRALRSHVHFPGEMVVCGGMRGHEGTMGL